MWGGGLQPQEEKDDRRAGPSEAQARPKRGPSDRRELGEWGDWLGDWTGEFVGGEVAAQGGFLEGLGMFLGMDWGWTGNWLRRGVWGVLGWTGSALGISWGWAAQGGFWEMNWECTWYFLGTGCAGALGIQGRSLGKACTSVLGVLKIVNLLLWTQKVVKMGLGGHFEDKMKAITVNLLLEDGKSVEAVILTKS